MSFRDIGKVSRNSYVLDIIQASEKQIDIAKMDFDTLEASIMVLATEDNIGEWEDFFKLGREKSWTLQDRVDRVVYTFNSRGFFTPKFLKDQANIFTNGEIDIQEDFENWHFVIQFTSVIGVPPNLDNFNRMVEINKPAHLTFEIKLRYRTHRELRPFTHLQLRKYTHKELRERGIITKGGKI